jgi:hypothetical protein
MIYEIIILNHQHGFIDKSLFWVGTPGREQFTEAPD